MSETRNDDTRRILVVFVAVMLGNSLSALDTTMVATALPSIVGDLGGLQDLSFVATAYLLTSLATVPLYGKLGDLYGRKRIFMIAIGIFLVGSVLCGTAQTMTQLILFRTVQGVGAGGLVSLPMAIVADLVPPRDLGRWIGYSGFVFAFSTVAGPLFGGFFAQHVSWRWAFFVNVPLGLIAVTLVARRLHLPKRRTEHRIDYLGAGLIVGAVTAIVLFTSWGGSREPWGSPLVIGLGVAMMALVAVTVVVERRAAEPVMPPRLFRLPIARVTLLLNALVGLMFYAALYFISAFLQFVNGISATSSGLYLIPLMLGTVTSTMLIGRLIYRTGRYRIYPILGGVVMSGGLLLLLRLAPGSDPPEVFAGAAVIGFGMGLVMQVTIVAIQNTVEPRDLGVATSSSMFSRQLGGAIGLALLGSIFTSRLKHWLAVLTPRSAHLSVTTLRGRPETLRHLDPVVRHEVVQSFSHSLHTVFLVCVPVALGLLVAAIRLREQPLREHIGDVTAGDDLAIALEGAAFE